MGNPERGPERGPEREKTCPDCQGKGSKDGKTCRRCRWERLSSAILNHSSA